MSNNAAIFGHFLLAESTRTRADDETRRRRLRETDESRARQTTMEESPRGIPVWRIPSPDGRKKMIRRSDGQPWFIVERPQECNPRSRR